MKHCRWSGSRSILALAFCIFVIAAQSGFSQANSWIGSGSGDWESPQWSFGLPAAGEDIFITNSGVKTIIIEPNTVTYYPGTMAVNSVTLSAAAGSSNTLYLNNSGLAAPLSMETLSIGSNCAVLMDDSALVATNAIYLNGSLTQGSVSTVTSGGLQMGFAFNATYNLDGILTSGYESIGGAFYESTGGLFAGQFLQTGGTNIASGGVGVYSNFNYILNAGELDGQLFIFQGGTFQQKGGLVNLNTDSLPGAGNAISVEGSFVQSGGILNGTNSGATGMSLPTQVSTLNVVGTTGTALQTGGTNYQASLTLGKQQTPLNGDTGQNLKFGSGDYTLSNGLLSTGNTYIWSNGSMEQSGGVNMISGTLSLQASIYIAQGYPDNVVINRFTTADYTLSAGQLEVGNLNLGVYGAFTQTGGTNIINNTLSCSYVETYLGQSGGVWTYISGSYSLNGGMLSVSNISAIGGGQFNMAGGQLNAQTVYGNVSQSGGNASATTVTADYSLTAGSLVAQNVGGYFHQTGGLSKFTNLLPAATYSMNGGLLVVTNLAVTGNALFQHVGGTQMTTLLTLDNGTWQELTNLTLSQFQLGPGTNSMILFPNKSCFMHFGDCSKLTWANSGVLTIVGWNGSTNGLGTNVLMFGTNASGLTAAQLSQIQFANPAGLPAGNYLANILSNGEIVPGGPSYLETAPASFFTGEASVGDDWFYLSASNNIFGYYSLADFPYIYHLDLGWEYYFDANDAQHGAYFYDFSDHAFFYTQPGIFPYIYDFSANAWLYYLPANASGSYSSNPRWFYNFATQSWVNDL